MSSFSRMTPLRRAALLAAPLAVAAVALSACNPTHVTSIESPTPSGSALATPYTAHESEAPAAQSAAPADASAFFSSPNGATYSVSSVSVNGQAVEPGDFTGVSIFGNAADGSATLTTLGLCDGSVYALTGKGSTVASTAGETWNTDKCGDPAGEAVAVKVHSILEGKLTASVQGENITLKGGKGALVLTADN